MDWTWLFVILCLGYLVWGIVGFVTNHVTGSRYWGDWPALPEEDNPEMKAAAEKWAEREKRKARAGR